ncbi:MAG: BREX-2 system phosphatase PglZ [Deltaproteobacteria bacterium]|nr:BREX-2 system phosphatase PglZ [Deltaproteobacteria bacterium]
MHGTAQILLRKLLEQAGGSSESGAVLVLDGEGLEDLPDQMAAQHGTYSVHRVGSEIRMRHILWKARGAPLIAVVPEALARRLPPDILRRARNQRVHALAPNDVLEVILGVRVVGADAPHLQALALEYVEQMGHALSRRTLPTVVDRRLLMELLVDVSVGETVRTQPSAALLASWVREPPVWSDNVRRLVCEALPTLQGDEGRLLAWALAVADTSGERLRQLVAHGALLTVEAEELPKDAWGPLWAAAAEPPVEMDRRILRRTVCRLVEDALALLGEAAGPLLTEAERIGRRALTESQISTSRVLPLAFHDRCLQLARGAANGVPIPSRDIEWLRGHRAAAMGKAELLLLEGMARLSRYLDQPEADSTDPVELVRRYQRDGAFADLATLQLRRATAGSGRYLQEARSVLTRSRERRDRDNEAFARCLASGYEAALHRPEMIPLHRIWKRLVAPTWRPGESTPLYLVVLDGCSYPVFLDLLYELAQHAAFPIGIRPDDCGRVMGIPALAPLPTVTSHARGAIFLGELPADPLVPETAYRDQQEAKTDKARFAQNPALGDRRRSLYLKGDLADGGQALIGALADREVEIVAAVFNAVDDQIGSTNTGAVVRLSPETIMGFRPSLEAALRAGRRVLLVADHGHSPYVDNSLRVGEGATPRYLPLADGAKAPAGFCEIDLAGLGGPPSRRAFAWRSGAYLGGPQVGFHGGCSLEEMVVPLVWLEHNGLQADEPAWWYGGGALPVVEAVRRAPEPPAPTPLPTPKRQLDMFEPAGRIDSLGLPEEVVAKLGQDARVILVLLKENGSLRSSELVKRINKNAVRVNGMVRQLRRTLHAAGLELFTDEVLPSGETLYRYLGGGT